MENIQREKLKIMHIAPFVLPINTNYGGVEQVVRNLDSESIKRGHDSFVVASKDSKLEGVLCPSKNDSLWPAISASKSSSQGNLASQTYKRDFGFYCEQVLDYIREISPDIIHDHVGFVRSSAFRESEKLPPILSTLHTSSNYENMIKYADVKKDSPEKRVFFNTVSYSQRDIFSKIINVDYVVYNAIDIEKFPFSEKGKGYAFFISSIYPEKGVETAIDSALALNKKIIVAGPVHLFNERINHFWRTVILPKIDIEDIPQQNPEESIQKFLNSNKKVMYVGELDGGQKKIFYKNSDALYFPVQLEEAFGFVMIEANACGVPVVAYRRGAVPEVIKNGVSGFEVYPTNIINFIDSASKINKVSRKACRNHIKKRFPLEKQISDYLKIYNEIVNKAG